MIYIKNIGKDEYAVSHTLGVLFTLAVICILAAIMAVYSFNFADSIEKTPVSYIVVSNNPDTIFPDIDIQHKVGDKLIGGDWWISIVPFGDTPVFRKSNIDSDFSVGYHIVTTNLTNGNGSYTVTNARIYTDSVGNSSRFISGGRYDVKIISYLSKGGGKDLKKKRAIMILDNIIEVR